MGSILKNFSILKKFLFINLIVFIVIGILTIVYLNFSKPNLIYKKTSNHIAVINNTTDHIKRLKINFNKEDLRRFLFSTGFLFQSLDRVIFLDTEYNVIADTDTLDLDPRSFSQRTDQIEFDNINTDIEKASSNNKKNDQKNLSDITRDYFNSKEYGKPFTYTEEYYDQFILNTLKNFIIGDKNVGYILVAERANDIKTAIDERKNFVIRTAILVTLVIFVFSFVLNRYFLKPIKNLVDYTKIIKDKSEKKTNIQNLKKRGDELGVLSSSLDDMTHELQKRADSAENFSTDLVHEIRNPLASLKSASEIISETDDKNQRDKLVKILSHDVERIERLITDYSQMLKDEVAITKEQMKKIDLRPIVTSVVDDFNSIYMNKRGIKISLNSNQNGNKIEIMGIENRIEQILANLLENSISFSEDNKKIVVKLSKKNNSVMLDVLDEGSGFKENDTKKIFKRFYSNRPGKFGEHSGLGLNIVKNLIDLHGGTISASNNNRGKGAKIEIIFPSA
jgi:two-component system sensor histidine kinase ChvG